MANYDTLKSSIQAVIKQNGNNEITGELLQQSLLAMINSLGVGYQFAEIATPETDPGTPDQRVFYLASERGEYVNFDGIVVYDELCVLAYSSEWTKLVVRPGSPDVVIRQGFYNKNTNDWRNMSAKSSLKTLFCFPGEIYYFDGFWGGDAAGAIFYGQRGEIVGLLTTTDLFGEHNQFVKIPANTYKVTFISVAFNNDVPTRFVVKNLRDIQNLNETAKEHSGFLRQDGTYSSDTSFHCLVTPIVPCIEGDIFYYRGQGYNLAMSYLLYNGSTIVSYGTINNYDIPDAEKIEIPTGVDGIVFSSMDVSANRIVLDVFGWDNATIIDFTNFEVKANLNKFAKSIPGYLNENGGVTASSTIHGLMTSKIGCKPGDMFYYRGIGINLAVSYIFYNGTTIVETGQINNYETNGLAKIVAPSSCDGVVFASFADIPNDVVLDVYSGDLADIINSLKEQIDSPLTGKSINWLGDSYVANHSQPIEYTWHYKIAAKYGMIYRNYGANGTGIVSGTNSMDSRYTSMNPVADYVMVVGGTNDYNYQTPLATFKSQLGTFIENLIDMYPTAKIAFWTPWNNKGMSLQPIPLADYASAMVEVCDEYGVPCFDAFKHGGVFAWNADVRAALFQGEDDYAHLNEDGHNRFISRAEAFLIGL